MIVQNDISLTWIIETVIYSGVGLFAANLLKYAITESGRSLITTLFKTMARVELLDAKIGEVLLKFATVDKLKSDTDIYFARLRTLEKINESKE